MSCRQIKDLKYAKEGTVIDLSKKGLTEIPDDVLSNKEVKILRLFGNMIDSIPESIGDMQYYLGPIITSILFVAIHGYLNPMNCQNQLVTWKT